MTTYLDADYGNQVALSSASTNSTYLGVDLEKKGSIMTFRSTVSRDSELSLSAQDNAPEPHMGLMSSSNMVIC
jgi:hypothetical protein